jgi:hypothetical protein
MEGRVVPSDLVFPDGVRLARLHEIPGPEPRRAQEWARLQHVEIHPGFVVCKQGDPTSGFYAEANVDAPRIWGVFCDLCEHLLGQSATLLIGDPDEEPFAVATNEVSLILGCLEPYRYQLAHDGFIQFGLMDQERSQGGAVLVAPTKYFKLWFTDVGLLRVLMKKHGIPETKGEALQFLDQYPSVTTPLPAENRAFLNAEEMILHMEELLAAPALAARRSDVSVEESPDLTAIAPPWLGTREVFAKIPSASLPTPAQWQRRFKDWDQDVVWHVYMGAPEQAEEVPAASYEGWFLQSEKDFARQVQDDRHQGILFCVCKPDGDGFSVVIENEGASPALWLAALTTLAAFEGAEIHCGNYQFSGTEFLRELEWIKAEQRTRLHLP